MLYVTEKGLQECMLLYLMPLDRLSLKYLMYLYKLLSIVSLCIQWLDSNRLLPSSFGTSSSCISLLYFTFYGMMTVAVTPNQHIAAIISLFFYAVWNLFSGLVVPRPRIPI